MGFNTPGAASSAADLEVQDPPKSGPEPPKNDVEKPHVFGIDVRRVRTSFWKGFRKGFWIENARKRRYSELYENLTKHCVGARFFDVGSCKKQQKINKNRSKIACCWDIDLGWTLGWFWEGFGRPKSLIFAFFSRFFRCHF